MKTLKPLQQNLSLLHALRGIAALYVVIFHAKFILWSGGREYMAAFPRSEWNIADYLLIGFDSLFLAGPQMVIIFFVLSGYFIAMSLDNLKGSLSQKLEMFYSVRFTRIYIPYIASMVLGVLVLNWVANFSPELYTLESSREFNSRLITAHQDVTLSNLSKALTFQKDKEYFGFNYAYWSLLYEAIFYIVAPFVFHYRKYYFLISAILFVAGSIILNVFDIDKVLVKYLLEFNFYFAIGKAMYTYRESLAVIAKRHYFPLFAIGISTILFLAFNFLSAFHFSFAANFLAAVASIFIITLLVNRDFKNSYGVRAIKLLGNISYSIYLIHIPVLIFIYSLAFKYTGKNIFYSHGYYFFGIGVSLLAGWIFYKIVEKPSLAVIKKIRLALSRNSDLLPAV